MDRLRAGTAAHMAAGRLYSPPLPPGRADHPHAAASGRGGGGGAGGGLLRHRLRAGGRATVGAGLPRRLGRAGPLPVPGRHGHGGGVSVCPESVLRGLPYLLGGGAGAAGPAPGGAAAVHQRRQPDRPAPGGRA